MDELYLDDLDLSELIIEHSGVAHDENPPGRGSGRYAYGSGDKPNQREPFSNPYIENMRKNGSSDKEICDLMKKSGFTDVDIYKKLHKAGWKDTEIAEGLDMKTTKLRAKISIAKYEQQANDTASARAMHEQGLSNSEIGRRLGVSEGTIRNYLNPDISQKNDILKTTADSLKDLVAEKKYIDIGPGADLSLGVTSTKLATAVAMLEEEGYKKFYVYEEQLGTGKKTTITVLAPPGTTYPELMNNRGQIKTIDNYIQEGGELKTRLGIEPPTSVDSSRIQVRWAEDGGTDRDGTIEIRRGVEDLSLGSSSYAQVRIAVDGTHYLKGMAIYGNDDEFEPGKDIIFNTNKKEGTPLMLDDPDAKQVFKHLKDDPDNPFGASIKIKDGKVVGQRHYTGEDGKDHLSPVNIIREEGDWSEWSKTLASQMLSKQTPALATKQLRLAYEQKKEEFEDYMSLTNPTVKKKLLEGFAEGCDAAAVNLKAAALPGQQNYVILPVPSMKTTEIYAPRYDNGTECVLIRYPHAGQFEIPRLIVNNKNAEAKSFMYNAKDAVGIAPKVAEQLSGADFDGDTVLLIPTARPDGTRISDVRNKKAIQELVDFNPKMYEYPDGVEHKKMSDHTKQVQMGMVSNLITDMTIGGASPEELVRAVKHSMVVIDAQKHGLNYKQSEKDNRIDELRQKYQAKENGKAGGASTIISRASAEQRIGVRKRNWKPDAETGEVTYRETPEYITTRKVMPDGTVKEETRERTIKTTRMAYEKDARNLMSGPNHEGMPIERIYAKYANDMKALANQARKEALDTPLLQTSPSAKKVYAAEVESLENKLREAKSNAPRERQAQILANEFMRAKRKDDPNMDADHLKKAKSLALANARDIVGAKKTKIEITDKEWQAIQSGAISDNKLRQILNNADDKAIKQLAMPRTNNELSNSKQSLIKSMSSSGYSIAEIAERLDVSSSTVSKYL